MNKEELLALFAAMDNVHVVVVGDIMMDSYYWGDVERISPEAPVPIVQIKKKEERLGGAANVALNAIKLGAKVSLASIVGDDVIGDTLIHLCKQEGIQCDLIQKSTYRVSTRKSRILSRNQQMIRLDEECTQELNVEEEHPFIDRVLRFLQREKPHVLIFEDYNKGLLKPNVIQRISAHCKELQIPILVDPKKDNFFCYKEVDVFKPNIKELKEGLNLSDFQVTIDQLTDAHNKLKEQLHHKNTFITLSEKGVYIGSDTHHEIQAAHIRNIADVSGAGDTVIATAALVYVLQKNVQLMAQIANIAGGLVCETVGVQPIDKNTLLEECLEKIAVEV